MQNCKCLRHYSVIQSSIVNIHATAMSSGRSPCKRASQPWKSTKVSAFGRAISSDLLDNWERISVSGSLHEVILSWLVECPRTTVRLLQRTLRLPNLEQMAIQSFPFGQIRIKPPKQWKWSTRLRREWCMSFHSVLLSCHLVITFSNPLRRRENWSPKFSFNFGLAVYSNIPSKSLQGSFTLNMVHELQFNLKSKRFSSTWDNIASFQTSVSTLAEFLPQINFD